MAPIIFLTLKTFIFMPQIKTFLTAKPSLPSQANASAHHQGIKTRRA
jgi:hypothetical protein